MERKQLQGRMAEMEGREGWREREREVERGWGKGTEGGITMMSPFLVSFLQKSG